MVLFTVSKDARQMLERLQAATDIRASQWVRVAFGASVNDSRALPDEKYDSGGSYFHDYVFYAGDEHAFHALLREFAGKPVADDELGSLFKRHVERGVRLLTQGLEACDGSGEKLILSLVESAAQSQAKLAGARDSASGLLMRLVLGKAVRGGAEVAIELNRPGTSPHVAIMGRSGSGKTRSAKSFLTRIAQSGTRPTPVLVFDYAKGDLAADETFVRGLGATTVVLPDELVPLAPVACESKSDIAIKSASLRFRDTICSVVKLGPKQRGNCMQLIERAFRESDSLDITIQHVFDVADAWYQENGLKADSLIETLRDMTQFCFVQNIAQPLEGTVRTGVHGEEAS